MRSFKMTVFVAALAETATAAGAPDFGVSWPKSLLSCQSVSMLITRQQHVAK